jgi:hypothetical protein
MCSSEICSTEPGLAQPDGPVSKIGWSRNSRNSYDSSETMTVEPDDQRIPLVRYLENPGHIVDKKFGGKL